MGFREKLLTVPFLTNSVANVGRQNSLLARNRKDLASTLCESG